MQKTISMDEQSRGNATNNDPCKHKRKKDTSLSGFRSGRKLHLLEVSKETWDKVAKEGRTLYTLWNRREGNHLQQRNSHLGNGSHCLTVKQKESKGKLRYHRAERPPNTTRKK